MNDLLLQSTCNAINVVEFISMNADEVTTLDNASCTSFHIYVVQVWKRIPLLVCVEMVEMQEIIDNVFQFMFRALETLAGVSVEVLGCKFISIGTNGNNVFQG